MNFLQPLFNLINKYLFSPVLGFFTDITGGSFAAGIFLFTLVINIALIPLSIKSQKASISQIKLKPKLDELKRKYGDDKQKYQAAMQQLYTEEKVSMGGGCLPMLIRMILILSVYYLVIAPLTYLTNLSPDVITKLSEAVPKAEAYRPELYLIQQAVEQKSGEVFEAIKDLSFELFGALDLTKTPEFSLSFATLEKGQLLLWIIPIMAFAAAMFSSIISLVQQKKVNPDAPNMAGMMLTMPIISLVISFSAPAGLGFYWACSSLIGGIIQAGVTEFYGPYKMIAKQQAKAITTEAEKEEKYLKDKSKK